MLRFALIVAFLVLVLVGELVAAGYFLVRQSSYSPAPTVIPLPAPVATAPSPTPTRAPTSSPTPPPRQLAPASPAARQAPKPPPPKTYNYTSDDLWKALADYRSAHRRYQFNKDDRLCAVAQDRLQQLLKLGTLDAHKGFKERFSNDEAFLQVGFAKVGENLASGFETAVKVIEWGWDTSTEGHREAQLSDEYTHACIATSQGISVLTLGAQPL